MQRSQDNVSFKQNRFGTKIGYPGTGFLCLLLDLPSLCSSRGLYSSVMHSFGHGMADKRASLGDSFSFQQSKISMNDVFIPMTAPQSSPVDIE